MDLSSSAVIKRHLIEPIKLDANIKRSLLSASSHDIPIIECSSTLDFIKVLFLLLSTLYFYNKLMNLRCYCVKIKILRFEVENVL